MILAKEIEKYPQTLYNKTTLDLDGDGGEEEIDLHVNAGKTESGLFAWDDGQNWLLVVKDGEKTYRFLMNMFSWDPSISVQQDLIRNLEWSY